MQVLPLFDDRFVADQFGVEFLRLFGVVPNLAGAELGFYFPGFLLRGVYVKDSRACGSRGRAHPQWVQRN